MPGTSADLHFRGLVHQMTDPRLEALLDGGGSSVYAGFDPSAPSLHVGHLMQMCTLKRLQLAGHRPIALAGGGTGAIGDPGGKTSERRLLSSEELEQNLAGVRAQLERFLDPGTVATDRELPAPLVLDNAAWLGEARLIDFLRDVGKHFTVNQMVAKESVRSRIERPEHGISFTEFSYMLLQAYDFLELFDRCGCTVQLGGSDQWGNITMGTELIRKVRHAEAFGFTTPLVTRSDGTKFGKTEEGTVWLSPELTSPFRLYQFLVRTEDADVGRYLRAFTFLSQEEITALDHEVAEQPRRQEAQRVLAREVTTLVHGPEEAAKAARASAALFSGKLAELDASTFEEVVADAPSSAVDRLAVVDSELNLLDALVRSGLVASRGEGRRTVDQGGVYLNDVRQDDAERPLDAGDLLHGRYLVLRRGRRQYHVIEAR